MATFPVELSYGDDLTQKYLVKRKRFGENRSQRTGKGKNNVAQNWKLVWNNVKGSDYKLLKDFFDGLAGVDTFDWTPPEELTMRKFSTNNFTGTPVSYNLYNCSCDAEEEFDG